MAHLPLAMTAHVVYTDIDDTRPATTSPPMIDLIRNDIGFKGLLMTDDLSMNALTGDVISRTQNALAAGVDVILHCNGHLDEMQEVAQAAGLLTEVGQKRATAALGARKSPEPVDIAASEAELASLLTGQWHV
jgi:beta-N-acetylhexosaminidase